MENRGHIRFGVICHKMCLYTWQEIVVKKLISKAHVELKLIVYQEKRINKEYLAPSSHHASDKSGFLWNLYYSYWVKGKSKTLQMAETITLFKDVPSIYCKFIFNNNGIAKLEDTDIEKIRNTNLDFIINFSSIRLTGNALHTARYGIWSFLFGNPEKYKGSIPCFWEIYHEDNLTSAFLVRQTDDQDRMIVLKEGHLKTCISYPENINQIHSECTSWPLKICQDIRNKRMNFTYLSSKIKEDKSHFTPGNLQLLAFFLIQLKLLVKKVSKMLFYVDYWNIGVVNAQIHEFLNSQIKPSVKWYPDLPNSRFIADPFGITFKDKLYILYEDFRFDQGIGKTASFLFQEDSFVENQIVIDEKFHMSYPFLLEHEGGVYCIPETYQSNQVRLYKAVEFPVKWKLEKVLIENYPGIDNTIFKHEDIWFMFSTNKQSGPHYNLNIHFSETIFGPWQEHPKNPVKTDIRSVRPAGTLFEYNGAVYRPSMDYSKKVEGRIVINKILILTTKNFKEEVHNMVNPFKNTFFSDKLHTLSPLGSNTLVDGAKELFVFSNFHVLKYKVNRIFEKLKR